MADLMLEMLAERRDVKRWGRNTMQWHYERRRHEAMQCASVWMSVAEQVKQW